MHVIQTDIHLHLLANNNKVIIFNDPLEMNDLCNTLANYAVQFLGH